jgi:hypothetical protein
VYERKIAELERKVGDFSFVPGDPRGVGEIVAQLSCFQPLDPESNQIAREIVTPRQLVHRCATFKKLLGDAPLELQTVASISSHDQPLSSRLAPRVQSYLAALSSFWGSLQNWLSFIALQTLGFSPMQLDGPNFVDLSPHIASMGQPNGNRTREAFYRVRGAVFMSLQ